MSSLESGPLPDKTKDRDRSRSPPPQMRKPTENANKSSTSQSQPLHKVPLAKNTGIRLKLGSTGGVGGGSAVKKSEPKKLQVSSAFRADDDDSEDEEEMPAFASMRMKNIGRNTPTSSGPNSFGKTKHGFCDQKKKFEKLAKDVDD